MSKFVDWSRLNTNTYKDIINNMEYYKSIIETFSKYELLGFYYLFLNKIIIVLLKNNYKNSSLITSFIQSIYHYVMEKMRIFEDKYFENHFGYCFHVMLEMFNNYISINQIDPNQYHYYSEWITRINKEYNINDIQSDICYIYWYRAFVDGSQLEMNESNDVINSIDENLTKSAYLLLVVAKQNNADFLSDENPYSKKNIIRLYCEYLYRQISS